MQRPAWRGMRMVAQAIHERNPPNIVAVQVTWHVVQTESYK